MFKPLEGARPYIKSAAEFAQSVIRANGVSPSTRFWDQASDVYRRDLISNHLSDPDSDERATIREIIKRHNVRSVLDVGCGPATEFASYQLDPEIQNVRYIGMDLNARMLDVAHNRYPDAVLVRGELERLPFLDASMDAVVMKHILEHQPGGYETAMKEAIRVAKKVVVIDFFHAPLPFGLPNIAINDRDGYANNWYSQKGWEKFLKSLDIRDFTRHKAVGTSGYLAVIYDVSTT